MRQRRWIALLLLLCGLGREARAATSPDVLADLIAGDRLRLSRLFARSAPEVSLPDGVQAEGEVDGQYIQPSLGFRRPDPTLIFAAQLGLSLDTSAAGWWRGGRLVFAVLTVGSSGNPDRAVGDLQGISALYQHTRARFHDIYVRQRFGFGLVRLGVMNGNDYFDATGLADILQNGSFSLAPTIGVDISGLSHSGLGAVLRLGNGQRALRLGVFQGDPVDTFQHVLGRGGIGFIELDDTLGAPPGRLTLKLGAWQYWQSRRFAASLGPSLGGFYGIAEWRRRLSGGARLGVFAQLAANPHAAGEVAGYTGVGVRLSHFVIGRPHDVTALGVARAFLRHQPEPAETAVELAYLARVAPRLYLEPDLQWIRHADGQNSTAWVGLIGFGLAL